MWQDGKPKNWYYAIPNTKIVNGLNIADMGIGSLITFGGEQLEKLEFDEENMR